LTNWGTFNGANSSWYGFGSSPQYVKLRYYPGYNLGESFDMSFIVNWDLNDEKDSTRMISPRDLVKEPFWLRKQAKALN
jgi:hypothetical protein